MMRLKREKKRTIKIKRTKKHSSKNKILQKEKEDKPKINNS